MRGAMLTHRVAQSILLVLVAMLSISSTGCIPRPITVSPGVEGVVIDQTTRSPIECVKVYLREHPDAPTLTDSDGYFAVEARIRLGVILFFGDHVSSGTLIAEKAGYGRKEKELLVMDGQVAQVTFELSPKSDPSP